MTWTNDILELPGHTRTNVWFSAAGNAKALVQINHGMAEHAGRYERFAAALAARGYAAVAHDHRGHGRTKSPGTSLGYFGPNGGWNALLDEAEAVREQARERLGVEEVVTFGHSMGSIAAFCLALRDPEAHRGLALWNSGADTGAPMVALRALLRAHRFFKGSDTPSALARTLTFDSWNRRFAPNRTGFDWLSRDEAEVDAYVADPLCGFPVTAGLWLDVTDGIRTAADDTLLGALQADLPVHLLGGGDDPCTENGTAMARIEARMRARSMSDVTLTILPDTRHESLNETNRDATTAAFIDWLDARFG